MSSPNWKCANSTPRVVSVAVRAYGRQRERGGTYPGRVPCASVDCPCSPCRTRPDCTCSAGLQQKRPLVTARQSISPLRGYRVYWRTAIRMIYPLYDRTWNNDGREWDGRIFLSGDERTTGPSSVAKNTRLHTAYTILTYIELLIYISHAKPNEANLFR